MLHEQESEHTVRGHMEAINYYRKMKDDGLIGLVGLSTHRVAGVRAAIRFGMDAVMAPLNVAGLGLSDGTRSDMETALREAKRAGLFTMTMKVLGGGHLLCRREKALQYVARLKFVDSVAVGMASHAEIEYNTALFNGKELPEWAVVESASAERRLMIEEGCTGCGRCAERCRQKAIYLANGIAAVNHELCVRCSYCAVACPEYCIKIV